MPSAIARLEEKLDATAFSVTTAGLSQAQMDEVRPILARGAVLWAFTVICLIVGALFFLLASADPSQGAIGSLDNRCVGPETALS